MNQKTSKGTAVVTGASAGLGAVYAARLAERGYDLILVARRGDRLAALADTLKTSFGVNIQTVSADLAAPDQLDQVVKLVAADASITLLVNNAGTSTFAPLAQVAADKIDAMTDINVTALARLTHAVLPHFKARNSGILINIGSVLSFHSLPYSAAYSGTKGYVMNFTRGLQEELADTAIVVQLVMPAATATEIWELSGVPIANLDPATVMTAENCVDAALAGLDMGETFTLPSVENAALWTAYDNARLALLQSSQNGKPASRYNIA
jgi:short-subunit dehydrogenase